MTDDEALSDFDADASDRITALIDARGLSTGLTATLAKSIRMAGGQLEHMKPAAFGMTRKGLFAGSVAMVPKRAVLIILANRRRVFQLQIQCFEAHPFAEIAKTAADYVLQIADGEAPTPSDLLACIDMLINREGLGIGQKRVRPELSHEHCMRIMGMLFLPLPADKAAGMYAAIEHMLNRGLCPALVGLCAPGSGSKPGKPTRAGAWPVCFPLAPYAEETLPAEPGNGANSGNKSVWSES